MNSDQYCSDGIINPKKIEAILDAMTGDHTQLRAKRSSLGQVIQLAHELLSSACQRQLGSSHGPLDDHGATKAVKLCRWPPVSVATPPVSSTSACCSTRRRKFCLCRRRPANCLHCSLPLAEAEPRWHRVQTPPVDVLSCRAAALRCRWPGCGDRSLIAIG